MQMIKVHQIIAGKYKIIRCIGKGGMSKVYLAQDVRLHTFWAVKEVIKRGRIYVNSLHTEAKIILQLHHPALPRVVDILEDDDTICLVMDYIEGHTLNELGKQEEDVVYDWAIQVTKALLYLHNQDPPIIYRDMKPENIIVTQDGHIKIIDFGTARTYKESQNKDTVVLGTKGYAPPEQYINQTDVRSDIYALGMTLYFMLSQKHPNAFCKEEVFASKSLQAIVCKCVEVHPENRFQNCEELLEALKNPQKLHKKSEQYRNIALFFLVAAILMGGKTMYSHHQQYEVLLKTSLATSYEEKLKRYEEAIHLFPFKMEAYEKMLETFEEDGLFSETEANLFLDVYNAYHAKFNPNSKEVAQLNYHIGRLYFNYYPEPFSSRILKASSFFEENHKRNIEFKQKQVCEAYYEICKFYKLYIFQSIYVDEASKSDYETILENSKTRRKQIQKESVYDQLAYLNALYMFLYDQKESMQQVHISKRWIETYMKNIYTEVSQMKVQKEASKKLKAEIMQLGGIP